MGVIFFLTLFPIILVVLGTAFVMAVVGVAVFVVGIGGSIVSAAALNNKKTKTTSLFFFASLLLLGISCIATLCGIYFETYFFIAPMLAIVGAGVVALGVIGIIKAFGIEKVAIKVMFAILLTLSAILGALVLASGVIALVMA